LYGTLRHHFALSARLDANLQRPLKDKDLVLRALILTGMNEILHMATPAHATVHETVEACVQLDRAWAKGLVNALLRKVQRLPVDPVLPATEEIRHEHPRWLIEALRHDWPDHWPDILKANSARPPSTLRVNQSVVSRDEYLQALASHGIAADPVHWSPHGVVIRDARPVRALPGYAEGWFVVQDEAAQLSSPLLECSTEDHVLDACAAPGGKTTHLLEATPGLRVVAVDVNARRMRELDDNLKRLKLTCMVRVEDVKAYAAAALASGESFTRIMLDAPCSALGVIRRHPDIRLRRSAEDVAVAMARQQQLLQALWPLLAPGGLLLYVTCSVLKAENDGVTGEFLATRSDARIEPIAADWGLATACGRQILPGMDDMDGFYFCRLRKLPQVS
ncbi:MAG: 16S rRNA (cytosine(967)-C(5))-methyltransferase RsmB, partial [Gammaproteobacteria bacterium]|nr:16S rRNA (cytosine(967)-C(5))-methyltransferase RsmB [Gammaproteobacteria bacterium]